ncbi:MAG TPA: hypothetical protein VEA69_13200 [Tepidisphaeraceae bacterium]|nr:hypothetical protein [Tepidisphaeraceae bacterium]
MARPAVDYPDPAEHATPNMAGADDLLAQLAGDEVDRLLAEAEEGGAATPESAAAATGPDDAADDRVRSATALAEQGDGRGTQAALDQLFDELDGAAAPGPAGPHGLSELVDEELTLAQQKLVKAPSRSAGDPSDTASNPSPTDAPVATGAAPAIPEPPSVADALAAEMDEDDRIHGRRSGTTAYVEPAAAPAEPRETPTDDLDAEPVDADADADVTVEPVAGVVIEESAEEPLEAEMADAADARVPMLVRVLEWMNAPLAGLSDGVREGLGKVAIVTTLNAVAVLLYVLIFRKGQG